VDEADHHLPGIITAITPQKKNRERYSVFVDDTFLIGVADTTLLKNDLRKGAEITPSLFRKLQRDEGRQRVKSYLLKLLSRRDHARRELFNKARRKDFAPEIIDGVLDELEERNFINAADFAEKYARDKKHLNDWGPAKIKVHLLQKGISKKISEQAVAEVFEETDLKKQFIKLIEKRRYKFLREGNTLKRKKKVLDYLQCKGYYAGDIYRYLEFLMEKLEG
jgi:regulatory protein